MAGGMHFLIGIATNDYVILASDKATFAYGAVLADDSTFLFLTLSQRCCCACSQCLMKWSWSNSESKCISSTDNDKEYRLGKKLTMMCIGEEGDVAQFGDWTKRNIRLYAIRNG